MKLNKGILYGALILGVGVVACFLLIRYNGMIYNGLNIITNKTVGLDINKTIDSLRRIR